MVKPMKIEKGLSNAIAALTALAGVLATIAGLVPESYADSVLAISTGAALLAGNLAQWRETFFGAALVTAAGVGAAVGASACGPRVESLPRIDFVGEEAALTSSFMAPASLECSEGSGCAGDIEGVGSVSLSAKGTIVVGDQSWPMTGEAQGFARSGTEGAELGASVCIDSELFDSVNKMLGLIDALNPGASVPRIPSPLCAEAR